eukprot:gene16490-22505_t
MGCVAYLTLWERKMIGWMHVRIGPNRVGPAAAVERNRGAGEGQQSLVRDRTGHDHHAGAGGVVVNATAKYSLLKNVELSLSAYNLFDKFDLRGNGGVVNSGVNPAVISGNPALGRTVTAAIRYTF